MKGQMTIEYLISFIIFVGVIAYIYLSYSANIPGFIGDVAKEHTRSKAFQLSEILVNDPGEPEDWDASTVERIGLLDESSNKQNLISGDKVDELYNNFPCPAQYDNLMNKLGMNETFSIIISKYIGDIRQTIYTCNPPAFIGTINVTIARIVALNDTQSNPSGILRPGEVIIQM